MVISCINLFAIISEDSLKLLCKKKLFSLTMYLPHYPVCLYLLWYAWFYVIGHMALLHWPIFLRCVVCDQASQSKGFCKDMWLEAVNPLQPSELCVTRITQVKGRLLWLRLEGRNKQSTLYVDHLCVLFNRNLSKPWSCSKYQKIWHTDMLTRFSPLLSVFVFRSD